MNELESNSRNHSITLGCRFDKTIYDLLKEDSRKRGISINSMINSILKKYIAWERYAEEIGFIPLAKETVRMLFGGLEMEEIHRVASYLGKTLPRELILLMFNRIDFNTIVAFLEITLTRYGMVQHNIYDGFHELMLYHNVNEKFSNFLAQIALVMAKDLSFKLSVKNVDPKTLVIEIEENSIH